jgi:hypothetical protein
MKKLLIMFLLATVTMSTTCSKEDAIVSNSVSISASQVPASVMSAFTAKYPAAAGQIEWELEDGTTYKVKFFIGAQRRQATFTSAGSFITEKDI